MPRSTSSVTHKKRVKKVLKQSKGYYGKRKNVYSIAKQSVTRSGMFAFAHRRKKKGDFRKLWQVRISAGLQAIESGVSYSRFIHLLKLNNILLNRKSLATLASIDPNGFKELVSNLGPNAEDKATKKEKTTSTPESE